MPKIGERVGAILRMSKSTVEFLGYGIYEGDFIPEEAVGIIAELIREKKNKNPRIRLDSGKIVYGCECWWGAEKQIQEKLKQYDTVKLVDIDDVRTN